MDMFDSMSNIDLLERVFATQSPSGAWNVRRGWFLPKCIATQVKVLAAFDAGQMEKGGEPTKIFCRIDKVVGCLARLGVPKMGRRCE